MAEIEYERSGVLAQVAWVDAPVDGRTANPSGHLHLHFTFASYPAPPRFPYIPFFSAPLPFFFLPQRAQLMQR